MKKSDICINEFTDKIQSGQMSRRKFNQILGAAGVSLVMTPMMSHTAAAAAADQAPISPGAATTFPKCSGPTLPSTASHPTSPHLADRRKDSPRCERVMWSM